MVHPCLLHCRLTAALLVLMHCHAVVTLDAFLLTTWFTAAALVCCVFSIYVATLALFSVQGMLFCHYYVQTFFNACHETRQHCS